MSVRKYNFTSGIETSTLPTAADAVNDNDIAPFSQLNSLFSTAGGVPNYLSGDSVNFNSTVGSWVAYDDVSAAVDGTGGSPTLTVTRSTTTPLRGSAHGLMTLPASNGVDQGASIDFTVDNADLGKQVEVSFDYECSSGLAVGDASDIAVYIYNKDGTTLITPNDNRILTASGNKKVRFIVDNTDNDYRLMLHVENEPATGSQTFKFTNIKIGPVLSVQGAVISDWYDFTPTGQWTGTYTGKWRRVGSEMEIQYNFVYTSGSGAMYFDMVSGYSVDEAKLLDGFGNEVFCGFGHASDAGVQFPVFVEYDEDDNRFDIRHFDTGVGTDARGDDLNSTDPFTLASSDTVTVNAKVPISGWDNQLSYTTNSVFRMSHVLVNGTQLTGGTAAAALGEYRIFKKSAASTATTVDTNAPATAITTADGMKIYATNRATGGTNGEPERWEIFIGKNKQYKVEYYKSAGKSGTCDARPDAISNDVTWYGVYEAYDPSTGRLTLDTATQASGTTGRHCGSELNGADARTAVTDAYFEVFVFDPPATFASENNPNSWVEAIGGNGHGSTNNKIRRFNSAATLGTAVTYADSSTDGASFTINENGIYGITYSDYYSVGGASFGVSVDSSQLTTGIGSITANDRLIETQCNAITGNCAIVCRLSLGSVVRPHTDGSLNGTGDNSVIWRITKITD